MSTVNLNDSDLGRVIQLHVGDEVRLSLGEISGTGFAWEADTIGDALIVVDESFLHPDKIRDRPPPPGAAGKREFQLKAMKSGSAELMLTYRRKWEGDRSAQQRVVTFEII